VSSPEANQGGERNAWDDILGPWLAITAIARVRRGVEGIERFVGIHTSDGELVYPHRQFETHFDEAGEIVALYPREKSLAAWHNLVEPIISGPEARLMMAGRLFGRDDQSGISWADELEDANTPHARVDEIRFKLFQLSHTL
jgi:hypothetical protein